MATVIAGINKGLIIRSAIAMLPSKINVWFWGNFSLITAMISHTFKDIVAGIATRVLTTVA